MTDDEVNDGVRITILVARRLNADLGRRPSAVEVQWRTATQFQARNPHRDMRQLTRLEAMALAAQIMDVVSTAAHTTP